MNLPAILDLPDMSRDDAVRMGLTAQTGINGATAMLARTATLRKNPALDREIAEHLYACKGILSKVGLHASERYRKSFTGAGLPFEPLWTPVLEHVLGNPLQFRNPTVWLLFQACLQAQADFAVDVCRAHSREDILSGRFLEGLKAACTAWRLVAGSYLERIDRTLEMDSIDLTVDGGEQDNGGDFGLILDLDDSMAGPEDLEAGVRKLTGGPRGKVYIPLIFQAKCYAGLSADISQKHEVRGYQLDRLQQAGCASSYIFYENDKEEIQAPALPMAKLSSACAPIELSRTTQVFEGSVDFASCLLQAANGAAHIPFAASRAQALKMIFADAAASKLTRIAVLGNTKGLRQQYEEALCLLRAEMEAEIQRSRQAAARPGVDPADQEAGAVNGGSRPRLSGKRRRP